MSITDRVTKLTTKLDQIDSKIASLTNERENLINEITSAVTGQSVTAKTATNAPKQKGPLGESIYTYLITNPGKDLAAIAKAVKSTPHQVGLAIYHLTKKARIFSEGGVYYPSSPVMAKNTPVQDADDL